VVDAFFAAARDGDFDALVGLLHPEVVLRVDFAPGRPRASTLVRGAPAVARQARLGADPDAVIHPVLVNGAAGVVITLHGQPHGIMAFIVVDGGVIEVDIVADPDRIRRVAAEFLSE
jgi:RNA polymerase sigma-70 factor (ECF subfamily)